MKNTDLLTFMVGGAGLLFVIGAVSKEMSCGPACQGLLADARGTLTQDMISDALNYWI